MSIRVVNNWIDAVVSDEPAVIKVDCLSNFDEENRKDQPAFLIPCSPACCSLQSRTREWVDAGDNPKDAAAAIVVENHGREERKEMYKADWMVLTKGQPI